MRLHNMRQASSPTPESNSQQTTWLLLEDDEQVVRYDEFDGKVFMLIARISSPLDLDQRLFRAGGDVDHEYLPEWVKRDDNGIIIKADGETAIMSFVRQWNEHDQEMGWRF